MWKRPQYFYNSSFFFPPAFSSWSIPFVIAEFSLLYLLGVWASSTRDVDGNACSEQLIPSLFHLPCSQGPLKHNGFVYPAFSHPWERSNRPDRKVGLCSSDSSSHGVPLVLPALGARPELGSRTSGALALAQLGIPVSQSLTQLLLFLPECSGVV